MEALMLNLKTKNAIISYRDQHHLVKYEYNIIEEILLAMEQNDDEKLAWFAGFGDSIRCITMNVHAYRMGLEFGFTEIAFDQYGWFVRPVWLNVEELTFGDTSRYGNYSTITLGEGANGKWAYGLSCNYGTGGCSWGISVYDQQFNSREDALKYSVKQLKDMMTEKIGHSDTTNYKQPIILATLRDIIKAEINMVQFTLF